MHVLAMMILPLDDPFPLYASALNYAHNLVVVKQNIEKTNNFFPSNLPSLPPNQG